MTALMALAPQLALLAVALESEPCLQSRHQALFTPLEVGFSGLFSLDYLLRLLCSEHPWRYARSFFGIVDLLSSIPPLLGLGAIGDRYFTVIRILRLMRVFRILKLGLYIREAGGFVSIPRGIYWAIVTITTVGYGDVAPVTPLGRVAASAVMRMDYSIIAAPTGIVTAELGRTGTEGRTGDAGPSPPRCRTCGEGQHLQAARFCQGCGAPLPLRHRP